MKINIKKINSFLRKFKLNKSYNYVFKAKRVYQKDTSM